MDTRGKLKGKEKATEHFKGADGNFLRLIIRKSSPYLSGLIIIAVRERILKTVLNIPEC